jgi:deazaflavin-dependent oxidoreductase (nitroreductase family)
MARIYGVIQEPLDRLVYRASGGATTASSWLAGVDIAMLTTIGARTGRPRTLPVLGLRDGDDAILIASNFGRPRHPSWYYNLRADPRATIVVGGSAAKSWRTSWKAPSENAATGAARRSSRASPATAAGRRTARSPCSGSARSRRVIRDRRG